MRKTIISIGILGVASLVGYYYIARKRKIPVNHKMDNPMPPQIVEVDNRTSYIDEKGCHVIGKTPFRVAYVHASRHHLRGFDSRTEMTRFISTLSNFITYVRCELRDGKYVTREFFPLNGIGRNNHTEQLVKEILTYCTTELIVTDQRHQLSPDIVPQRDHLQTVAAISTDTIPLVVNSFRRLFSVLY